MGEQGTSPSKAECIEESIGNLEPTLPHQLKVHPTDDEAPPLHLSKHIDYIRGLSAKMEKSFEGALMEHLRMSGVYWSVCAMSLLNKSAEETSKLMKLDLIVEWVLTCFDEQTGGFGGQTGHDGHLLYTLSALQILVMADRLDLAKKDRVVQFIRSLQQKDGSFCGDKWGEIDTRFTYCALSGLSLLNRLDAVDVPKAAAYILSCQNSDGGFGAIRGAESHAAQVFCCIGALSIANALPANNDILCWWLAERQCDSGGLNGRSEKQADVCYSWWILSALAILGRVNWISESRLATFILKCQDPDDGGIADRPDDMPDVYHTFFGLSGLSLLGLMPAVHRQIDPVYALPVDTVKRVGLRGQVVRNKIGPPVSKRLEIYDIIE